MCGFKHCCKSGRCFLEGVSPCPDKPVESQDFISKLGFNYEGFLEPSKLLSALGVEANGLHKPTDQAA